ncbi:MAG: 7-cyano-7-deazaguanine synthase QueC [Planctomycetota bacterium]
MPAPGPGDPAAPGVAIALLSGGLDSVVASALWLDRGGRLARCVTIDYGQRAATREAAAAERFCAARGVTWQLVPLPWLGELSWRSGSALVATERELPAGTPAAPGDDASAAAVWVPARNCVLLALGAAFAEAFGADTVLAGFNREEAATFPDNSVEFVRAAAAFLGCGTRVGIAVASPTQDLDKAGIVAAARRLGIDRSDVWSCYRGEAAPCGHCESCLRSARAWGDAAAG